MSGICKDKSKGQSAENRFVSGLQITSRRSLKQPDNPIPGGDAQEDQDRLKAKTDQCIVPHFFVFPVRSFITKPQPGRDEKYQRQTEIQTTKNNGDTEFPN